MVLYRQHRMTLISCLTVEGDMPGECSPHAAFLDLDSQRCKFTCIAMTLGKLSEMLDQAGRSLSHTSKWRNQHIAKKQLYSHCQTQPDTSFGM